MASQTQGIQQLLAAEKRAAEKLNEARTRKAKRLRQAKEDAIVEIEKYKLEREQGFRKYEEEHMGSRGEIGASIEADARSKIEQMNQTMAVHKSKVLEQLLYLVVDIKPQLHQNLRFAKF